MASFGVKARIVSQKGHCAAGHAQGQEFQVAPGLPAGFCPLFFHVIYPDVRALAAGGTFDRQHDPDRMEVACPDADNPVVVELVRER